MPPLVTAFGPWDRVPGPLQDQDILHEWALLQCGVGNGLGSNRLSATATFVGGDENPRLAILDTISQRFGRESSKDDRVDRPNASTSEERGYGLPGHRKIDRDGLALLDSEGLEDIGDAADLAEEFCIGDLATLIRFVGFINDGGLEKRSNQHFY